MRCMALEFYGLMDDDKRSVLRYAGLDEPRAHRHAMLDLSLHLYQYYRNVDVEIKWTQAKISEIDADTLGDSVTGVQRKQKAHANLQVGDTKTAFSLQPPVD